MMMFEYKSLLSRFKYVGSPKIIRFLLTCCAWQLLESGSSAREFRLSPPGRERIEVRDLSTCRFSVQNPHPTLSLGNGEANTCKAVVARCRDIPRRRTRKKIGQLN